MYVAGEKQDGAYVFVADPDGLPPTIVLLEKRHAGGKAVKMALSLRKLSMPKNGIRKGKQKYRKVVKLQLTFVNGWFSTKTVKARQKRIDDYIDGLIVLFDSKNYKNAFEAGRPLVKTEYPAHIQPSEACGEFWCEAAKPLTISGDESGSGPDTSSSDQSDDDESEDIDPPPHNS